MTSLTANMLDYCHRSEKQMTFETELHDLILDLGSTTEFPANDVANVRDALMTAGLNTSDIMTSLPKMLDIASSGAVDLGTATKIVRALMVADFVERFERTMVDLAYSMRGEIRGYTRRTIEILSSDPLAVNDRSTTLVHYHSAPHLSGPLGHPWYSAYRRRARARRGRHY